MGARWWCKLCGALDTRNETARWPTCRHWAGGHTNLTGDYNWQQNKQVEQGGFRPLPPLNRPWPGFDLGRSLATMFTNSYMDGVTPLGLSL